MNLILIEPNSPEWHFMWQWITDHPINKGIDNPTIALNEGQAWQYLGSYKQGERVIHTLRHRNHPTINSIVTLSLNASEGLTPDQISKTFKL